MAFHYSYCHLSVSAILSTEVIVYATPPTFLKGPENNHIISRSYSTDFYQSDGSLTVFQQ